MGTPVLSKRTAGVNELNEKYDFHPTEPVFARVLLHYVGFTGGIWEPACGDGSLSEVLVEKFGKRRVYSSDLHDWGYGNAGVDFLLSDRLVDNIVTNPPYRMGTQFVVKALELAFRKVAMLIKINFAYGVQRYNEIFSAHAPELILIIPRRMRNVHTGGSYSFDHAWFVWDNTSPGGDTRVIWADPNLMKEWGNENRR